MKKIFLLALLLGLTGCGNDNQNGASQADSSHGLGDQTIAKTMSASSLSLGGWTVTNSSAAGASTILEAAKDTRVSAALITPNAIDVAKILRGGAAGIALSLAVDQILGAVDWVLDPANNQIRYKPTESCILDGTCDTDKIWRTNSSGETDSVSPYSSCQLYAKGWAGTTYGVEYTKLTKIHDNNYLCSIRYFPITACSSCYVNQTFNILTIGINPNYQEKTLPLETVAEQVIDNADNDNPDAQVATNAAAQAILAEAYNDAVKAQPIVTELENNAENKCGASDVNCYPECEPPAGVKFNKVTHYEKHGRNPDPNVGSHGCMAKTGSPVHWHYDVNDQLPDGRCITRKHIFGGCGVAP